MTDVSTQDMIEAVELVANRAVWKSQNYWFSSDRALGERQSAALDAAYLCGWLHVSARIDLLAPAGKACRVSVTRFGAREVRMFRKMEKAAGNG